MDRIKDYLRITVWNRLVLLVRWLLISIVTGILLGAIGAVFSEAIIRVTEFRRANPAILYGLPVAGLVIVFCYQWENSY